MQELEKEVDRFLGYFRDKHSQIKSLTLEASDRLFKKALYMSLLDALSKTISYPKQGNRDRFVSLIEYFTDWTYKDRVSLTHLVKLLKRIHAPEFSDLREFAYKRLDSWPYDEIIGLDDDPEFSEVRKLWPNHIPKPLEGIQLEFITHKNLFYKYRNTLVHEMREPGQGMEFTDGNEPFYHGMTHSDNSETWELVYPLGFYVRIVESVLDSLKQYYMKDRINPYECYEFGSYWIGELN